MPRLRLLVVAFACACIGLIAPTAAAFSVATHLEWADHHGAPHPPHPTVPFDGIAADHHLDRSPHGHAIPELAPEPGVPRHRNTRADARAVGTGVVSAVTGGEASGTRSRRLPAPDRSGTSASRPDLLHLHCALLI